MQVKGAKVFASCDAVRLLNPGSKVRVINVRREARALVAHKQGHQRVGPDLPAPVTVNAGIETHAFRQGVG